MKAPTFIISNISLDYIDEKYNFLQYKKSNVDDVDNIKYISSKTKISDIPSKNPDKTSHFSFIDESKKDHVCVVTMKDLLNENKLPEKTDLHCFWCRHVFDYKPIGCPIEYKHNKLFKKYYSEITKTNYILQENITNVQFKNTSTLTEPNYSLDTLHQEYYLTDGIFCSFNCCYAFILENKQNPIYKDSEMLLKKIYYEMFQNYKLTLEPASNWRLLKMYGGDLTIEQFRENFFKIDFVNMNEFVTPFPNCKCVGMIFEKKIKL